MFCLKTCLRFCFLFFNHILPSCLISAPKKRVWGLPSGACINVDRLLRTVLNNTNISRKRLSSFVIRRWLLRIRRVIAQNSLPSKRFPTCVFEKTVISKKKPVVHRFLENKLGRVALPAAVELFLMLLDALQRTGLKKSSRENTTCESLLCSDILDTCISGFCWSKRSIG
jgi:hypothetical protein